MASEAYLRENRRADEACLPSRTSVRSHPRRRFVVFRMILLLLTALLLSPCVQADPPHWSFRPRTHPAVPMITDSASRTWVRTSIDAFVLARLKASGLRPAPEADRITLIRRLSFDLTGLPPTPAEVDAFVKDQAPDAYEKLVDRLLASSHYGERMALYWLDLVRYADTGGYHSDNHRDVWMYRDWVVDAFNR